MYEKLFNKNEIPTMEELLTHVGKAKEKFEAIEDYLTKDLKNRKGDLF